MNRFISIILVLGVAFSHTHGAAFLGNVLQRPSKQNSASSLLDTLDLDSLDLDSLGAYDNLQQNLGYVQDTASNPYDVAEALVNPGVLYNSVPAATYNTKTLKKHKLPNVLDSYNQLHNVANKKLASANLKDIYSSTTDTLGQAHGSLGSLPVASGLLDSLPLDLNNDDQEEYGVKEYGNQVYKLPGGQQLSCVVA